jgi:hypothetical protein
LPVIGPATPIRTSAAAFLAQNAAIKMALSKNNPRRTMASPPAARDIVRYHSTGRNAQF